MLYRDAYTGKTEYRTKLAKDFSPHANYVMPISGEKRGFRKTLLDIERFLIATQADGHIPDRYTGSRCGTVPVRFGLTKARKIERMRGILARLGFDYSETGPDADGEIRFSVDVPIDICKPTKLLSDWVPLKDMDAEWGRQFIQEVAEWDGYRPKNINTGNYIYYSSVVKQNADVVQMVAHLSGCAATITVQVDDRKESFSDIYRVYIHDKNEKRLGTVEKKEVPYSGDIYCFGTSTGAFLIRHNDKVSVTGNSLHSEAGCWLFREFIKENPEIWTDELKKEIYDAARTTIELEDAFIDRAFEHGDLPNLTKHDMKNYIRYRANSKLQEIGLKSNWKNIDKDAVERLAWFDVLVGGVESQDFFAGRVSEYSKATVSFEGVWS